jgi:hypothetical protein
MWLHYTMCEDFKAETLDKVRKKPVRDAIAHPVFWQKHVVDANPPTDPSAFLDNEIYPIFAEAN